MRKIILTLTIFIFQLIYPTATWCADFQRGMDAYKNGDFKTALQEWEPLAKDGNAKAQYNLGYMYDSGEGVPLNYEAAVKWYSLAAKQGDDFAQYRLDVLHYKGDGVLRDYKTATKWSRSRYVADGSR